MRGIAIALLGTILIFGCRHTTPPRAYVPFEKVTQQPPAANSLAPVRDTRAKEQQAASRADVHVENTAKELRGANEKLEAAVTEANRLRQQKTATEKELEEQWKLLTEIKQQSIMAQQQADSALKEIAERRRLTEQLSKEIEMLTEAIRKKDLEAEQAQLTLKNSENSRAKEAELLQNLADENKKLLADLNRALPYKHAVWWIVGAWVLFTIAKVVMAGYGIRLPF